MLKGTIYQKVLLRIATSSSIDQLIYSAIKWYEEMTKLTTWQREDSIRGCLEDYDRISEIALDWQYLIWVDKKIGAHPKAILQIEFLGKLKSTSSVNPFLY